VVLQYTVGGPGFTGAGAQALELIHILDGVEFGLVFTVDQKNTVRQQPQIHRDAHWQRFFFPFRAGDQRGDIDEFAALDLKKQAVVTGLKNRVAGGVGQLGAQHHHVGLTKFKRTKAGLGFLERLAQHLKRIIVASILLGLGLVDDHEVVGEQGRTPEQ